MADGYESDLTEMSVDEPPRISAKRAYDRIVPVLQEFTKIVDNITLPQEWRDEWKETMRSITTKATEKPYKVAIVGRTGAGKSTLLNALLHEQILAASASGACTAVVTEISYEDVDNFKAIVEFIPSEEWRKDLCWLMTNAKDKEVDTEEGATDNSHISSRQQAQKKIIGIYPQWVFTCIVDSLLNDLV
ncbi:hypothetical protein K438DRAFT_613145 [Mycena galopus ATCC 62051]|nr:hypothetical protein K438DRAFT_613145 [Mycena galopus ATCC 62051]